MDWRPAAPALPPAAGAPAAREDEPLSSDEEDEALPPPRQFIIDARELKGDVSTREAYAAWDKSRGIGGGSYSKEYHPASARVQAAFGFLFDGDADIPAAPAQPAPPSPRIDKPREAQASDKGAEPLFRPRSCSSSPIIIASPAKKRKMSPRIAPPPPYARGEVLELGDSDDEARPISRRDKGKGRAVKSPNPAPHQVISLLDSDDDEPMFIAPPAADRAPQAPVDPIQEALDSILAAIPDVLPSHVEELLRGGESADVIVDKLLGEGGRYPKSEGTRGQKRGWAEVEPKEKKEEEKDWMDVKKRGESNMHYRKKALDQLYIDFNQYATADIKKEFKSPEASYFYAPAWYRLRQLKKENRLTKINKARKVKPIDPMQEMDIPEFDAEVVWLEIRIKKEREERKQKQREEQAAQEAADRAKALDEKAEKQGKAIECQCCFGSYHIDNTTQCAAGCQFCKDCALGNAKERLGKRLHTLPCLADCGSAFSDFEARRFLPQSTLELLYRVRAEKELDEAGLEGLEKCPFCPYAAVIENPDERLFHCEREGCGKTSCRQCKEIGHVPLSCAEAKKEKKLPGLHQVEEAMTAALIRRCPKCQTPCIKSDGCNVMACTTCPGGRVEFCYVCGKLAGHGSSHFGGIGGGIGGKCPQFDDTEKRNFEEVEAARKAALAALDKDDVEALKADADKIAAKAPDRQRRAPAFGPYIPPPPPPGALFGFGPQYLQQMQQMAQTAAQAAAQAAVQGYGYAAAWGNNLGGGGGGFNVNAGGVPYGANVAGGLGLGGPAPAPFHPQQVVGGARVPMTAAQRRARAAEAAAQRAREADRERR